jgi:hypothetical protein
VHGPRVIGEAGRHRRGACLPLLPGSPRREPAETLVGPTEVVGAPDQIPPCRQRVALVGDGSAPPHQRGERAEVVTELLPRVQAATPVGRGSETRQPEHASADPLFTPQPRLRAVVPVSPSCHRARWRSTAWARLPDTKQVAAVALRFRSPPCTAGPRPQMWPAVHGGEVENSRGQQLRTAFVDQSAARKRTYLGTRGNSKSLTRGRGSGGAWRARR